MILQTATVRTCICMDAALHVHALLEYMPDLMVDVAYLTPMTYAMAKGAWLPTIQQQRTLSTI